MTFEKVQEIPEDRQDRRLCKLCILSRRLFILSWLNFLVFFAISAWAGGNATIGKIVDGHYFLGAHGNYREVSAALFNWMKFVEAMSMLVFMAGFAAIILHNMIERCKTVPKRWWGW